MLNIPNNQENVNQKEAITSYSLELLLSKTQNNKCWQARGEIRTLAHTVRGNVKWLNCYGKQYGDSSENKKQNHHMIQ